MTTLFRMITECIPDFDQQIVIFDADYNILQRDKG